MKQNKQKDETRVASKEETLKVAKQILEEHREAFKALASGDNNDKI